jgi:hypothetical protein
MVLKRATMAAVTALVTVNVWTGCPLLALWVGSRAVGTHDLSMGAVVVVLVVLALLEGAMMLLLAWLTNVYDELIGLRRSESEVTWIRRLCARRAAHARTHLGRGCRRDQRVRRRRHADSLVRLLAAVSSAARRCRPRRCPRATRRH